MFISKELLEWVDKGYKVITLNRQKVGFGKRNHIRFSYFHNLKNGNEINFSTNLFSSTGLAMGSFGVYYIQILSNTSSLKFNSQNHSFKYIEDVS